MNATTMTKAPQSPSLLGWMFGAIGLVWASIAVISMAAPDLVSGSAQEHLPLVGFTSWVAGLLATGSILGTMREIGDAPTAEIAGYMAAIGVVWVAATLVALLGPVLVTGGDPTRLPLAALIAPFGGAALTWIVGSVFVGFAPSRLERG